MTIITKTIKKRATKICSCCAKGDQASERWERMISGDTPESEKRQIKNDLLEYCEMDTWAMVRIWEVLRKIT